MIYLITYYYKITRVFPQPVSVYESKIKMLCITSVTYARSHKQFKYTLGNSSLQETTSHSYLGVEIIHNLKWGNRVNTLRPKQILEFIRCNLYSCFQDLKLTAYQTLVHPHLQYSSTVWDPYTQEHKDKIERVQIRSARFVCKD